MDDRTKAAKLAAIDAEIASQEASIERLRAARDTIAPPKPKREPKPKQDD